VLANLDALKVVLFYRERQSIGKSSHVVPSERIRKSQRGHLNASATLSIADNTLEDHDMTQSRPQGKKKLAVAALNAYAARVGQSRRSDAAAQTSGFMWTHHVKTLGYVRLEVTKAAVTLIHLESVRLSGRERACLERAELGMTSDELEALETAREERLSTFAAHARQRMLPVDWSLTFRSTRRLSAMQSKRVHF